MPKLSRLVALAFAVSTLAGSASAQRPDFPAAGAANPATASYVTFYNIARQNILEGAEAMPEKDYAYRPTADVRTFAALVAHIADAQYIFCSSVRNQPNPNGTNLKPGDVTQTIEQSKKHSKAEMLAALKQAFAYCDPIAASTTDANWSDVVRLNGAERPAATPLTLINVHLWEHYGNMVTYLRLKGVVPPSTARTQQPRRP